MNEVRNMPPTMSMLDVVRGANRRCDNTTPCMIGCEYYDFCGALKAAYYEVLRACDHNKQLKSFITHAMNDDTVKIIKNSIYGEMKKEAENEICR